MDAKEYRLLTSGRNVLDFATLKETEKRLLETGYGQLARSITRLLADNGINRPVYLNKIGERKADYYRVDLLATDIEVIVSMFCDKEVGALNPNFEITLIASYCASLLDK